jgi:ATP-dependent DNA helicase RecG
MAKAKTEFNPRTYMELAIEEMNKSINEPRTDGKVPPKVGAIMLFPDGTVVRAHRGELREGDHAEFTLMERKLVNVRLDDCILFTTLEPCVERTPPKVACCKRTTKARIKTVYVGIGDPDPTVDGKGIEHLEDFFIDVKMFDRDLQLQIENANTEFIKQAVERKSFPIETKKVRSLEKNINKSFDELSAEALQKFITEANLKYDLVSSEFKKYLSDLGALVYESETSLYKTTMAGILLFGHEPRLLYKQASLKVHIKYDNGAVEQEDFDDALVLLPEKIENWLKKVLPSHKNTSSFKREDVLDFPIEVLREAVINAIVHRDYDIEGAKSSIEIDPLKIVVKSPGAPLPVISIEQLNSFSAPSISRNPIITYVFNKMKYVEEKGFGMQTMKSINDQYNLPLPEFSFTAPFLTLTFPRSMAAVKVVSSHPGVETLNDEELLGYEFIKSKDKISRVEYERKFRFETKKAERQIKKLLENNLIERLGGGAHIFYRSI